MKQQQIMVVPSNNNNHDTSVFRPLFDYTRGIFYVEYFMQELHSHNADARGTLSEFEGWRRANTRAMFQSFLFSL
jgi:hypothetical protein